MFRRWGYFVARHARVILIASLALLVVGAPLIPTGLNKLQAEGWVDNSAQSSRVATAIAQDFGQSGSSFWIVFSSPTLQATSTQFQTALQQALAPLRSRPEITAITDYPTTHSNRFISKNGRETYVVVTTSTSGHDLETAIPTYQSLVHSPTLTRWFGGSAPANAAFSRAVESDLRTQETLSLPITLILLVVVFGSLVAAGLPLAVGILSIPAALGGIAVMAHLTNTSIYVLNIATILGLAVSIDYSLFIVTRFREELHHGRSVADAVSVAMSTAGKAVFFSGMIVTVGLLGMVFFPMFALRSMGLGGAVVVGLAVFYAFTFLPALLALLGPRIDRLRVRDVAAESRGDGGLWSRLASGVMRYPVAVILPVLALLIALGLPFLNANFGTPGMDMLPK
ncbi:MAG TPA: MMPL family transporter, partial [Thermomicrobiaceae bacterium]|nr:MMPL family transporter [Thermomicrobiaceae bacterium]